MKAITYISTYIQSSGKKKYMLELTLDLILACFEFLYILE